MDSYKHKGLRSKLTATVKAKGITDKKVLNAINLLPRHLFLDKAFEEWSYKDQAFPIGEGQTISQPYTVAFQTELLELNPNDKVLEIGTGSGYQACILSLLCKRVYSIERQRQLFLKTSDLLRQIGYGSIRTLFGDGYKGAPRFAPFDKILITAGASSIPQDLIDQLKIGGYLVLPLGEGDSKTMTRITKTSEDQIKREVFGEFRFVPFLEGTS